jgi:hypothetical protein
MEQEKTMAAVVEKLKGLSPRDLEILLALLADWESWRATLETLADDDLMAQIEDADAAAFPAEAIAKILRDDLKLKELLQSAT